MSFVYRWTLHPSSAENAHQYFKSVNIDMINRKLIVKAYSVVVNNQTPIEQWISILSHTKGHNETLTIKHYDGMGKPISIEQFSGLKPLHHSIDYDYAGGKSSSDPDIAVHIVTFEYDSWSKLPTETIH